MFRSLFPFRRLLAMSFLLVFANVLAGQCWCATVNPWPAARLAAANHRGVKKSAHSCCHGGKAAHHTGHGSHSRKPGATHDCCKDKSASLLASLTGPAEKHLLRLAPALLPAALEPHFSALAAGQWDRTAAVRLVPPQHLPPKIPDIRIFIQSLTV